MIRGLGTIAANFTQLAIIRIFRKNATHSRRISEKSAFPGELAFQTPLLGCPPMRRMTAAGTKRGWVMRFILRMAFWLTVILVLLPSGGSQPTPKVNVSASDAVSAAGATVSDMKQFCGRQSEACAVGAQVAVAIGHRAQAGAKMLYEFLNAQLGPNDTGAISKTASGKMAARPSQHTLTAADLAPPWRGPQPHREARREPAGQTLTP
jgi:hypothetical protein